MPQRRARRDRRPRRRHAPPPVIGGHEGAGVVVEVGEGVDWLEPGDHVVFGFVPACGRCAWCVTGHSNLCDNAAAFPTGRQIGDGTARHHTLDGLDLGLMCLLGTFAEHTVVNESSCVKIDEGLAARQGVPAGLRRRHRLGLGGLRRRRATRRVRRRGRHRRHRRQRHAGRPHGRRPGDRRHRPGRVQARHGEAFGATHTYSSIDEALSGWATRRGAAGYDKVIMTMGVGDGESRSARRSGSVGKRAQIVITNIHPTSESRIQVPAAMLTLFEKRSSARCSARRTSARTSRGCRALPQGQLNLDDLVTKTYSLDEINEGYEAMRNGENIRGVILFD